MNSPWETSTGGHIPRSEMQIHTLLNMVLRFLLIQSLMLWQGGFLFYALVVVPIGSEILGKVDQGFVTRQVTFWMNTVGFICLTLMLIETTLTQDPSRKRKYRRHALMLLNAALLVSLVQQRSGLDRLLDERSHTVNEPDRFYQAHEWYLTVVGIQWFLMLAAAWLTLTAWRAADRTVKLTGPSPEQV
ncbi:hypothetical protein BH11PLA2_BH11PLA2_35410 [soil metagenome]